MRDDCREHLRDRIAGLQMHEKLAVALDEYDALRAEKRDRVIEVVDKTGLQRLPAVVFLTLWDARGNPVTYDTLQDRVETMMGWHPSVESIRQAVKRIRKADLPVTITALSCLGYKMTTPPGWALTGD